MCTIYAEVNHDASANASKSAAMSDCAVVIIDILVAFDSLSIHCNGLDNLYDLP